MRRTVVIEDTLLEDAQRLLVTRGIRDTIEECGKSFGGIVWRIYVIPWERLSWGSPLKT